MILCLVALGMVAALFLPENEIVYFFGNYGLACFSPLLATLLLRRWNRTLAFPAALFYMAIAVISLIFHFNLDGFLETLFVIVPLMIAAASDRISFIYKWRPPFNYIGIVGVAFALFFVVYFAIAFVFFAFLMIIVLLALLILISRSLFGYRRDPYRGRNGGWY